MDESRVVRAENPQSKEVFSTTNLRIALQTRLILGEDALKLDKINLGKVAPEQLSEIKPETIGKINRASTKERSDYWQGKGTFDQQLKSWCDSMIKYYNDPRFTEKEALEIYHHYFGENKSESNINIYADEVIANHTQNGKINFDQLNQNLPKIIKMAHIFGGNSSEIIEDLILARAKLSDPAKKQELIDQVNEEKTIDDSPTLRINYLNPDEERLLKWLDQNEQVEIKTNKSEPSPPVVIQEKLTKKIFNIEAQDIDFSVSYEQNRKAADQFIAVLRDPKHLKTSPTYLFHDYGFVFDGNNGGTIDNPELLATRYHLPFATYSNHLIPEVSHSNLVIRGPHFDPQDSRWKITIYNPYQLDIKEETLENVHNQQEALAKISYNKLWGKEYLINNEDISFVNDPELRPYLDALVNAKLAPFQRDMINCYPYCFFVGSMLNALKPGQTDFKTQGITQFSKDYQLDLADRDEVLKRLRQHTQP